MRDLFIQELFVKIKTTKFYFPYGERITFQSSNTLNYLAVLTAIARANQIIRQRNKLEGGTRPRTKVISPLWTAGVWNYFVLSPAVPAYPFSPYMNKEQGTKSQDYVHLSPQTILDIYSTFSCSNTQVPDSLTMKIKATKISVPTKIMVFSIHSF